MPFGQFPFTVYVGDDSQYHVSPEFLTVADECGVNYNFDLSRLSIMVARAQSYGYALSIVDAPTITTSKKG